MVTRDLSSLSSLKEICKAAILGAFYILFMESVLVSASPIKDSCEFHGQQKRLYPVGSQWEIRVGSHKDFLCMNCTCSLESGVRCVPSDIVCPPLDDCIKVEDVPDSCCPKCTETRNEADCGTTAADKKRSTSGCHHNGQYFANGDRWAPELNSTSIQPQSLEQCVLCDCQDGKTICHLKGCAVPKCKGPTVIPKDNCCPVCQDAIIEDAPVEVYDVPQQDHVDDYFDAQEGPYPSLPNGDCISGPDKYENGAEWNPVVPPFGKMKCVVCRCESGNINCKRLECPAIDPVCKKTVVKPGTCCPVCQELNEVERTPTVGTHLCVRKDDYLVYENLHGGTVEIALRLPSQGMISVHTWKVGSLTGDINSKEMKMLEFIRTRSSPTDFRLLGVARHRRVHRFFRRVTRIRATCQQNCGPRIERLVELLRIRPVQLGAKSRCADDRYSSIDTRIH